MPHRDASSIESLHALKAWAAELGFAALGVSRAEIAPESAQNLMAWLARGEHGTMDYMARHAALRVAPTALLPGTCSIVSVALDYAPEAGLAAARATLAAPDRAYVSRYALGRDYHKPMRQRLQKLAERMTEAFGAFRYRVFSDSAPVMETELARKAALGWRGKHTLVLSRQGSLRFLGELYTDLPLASAATAEAGHCGRCRACLEACPTRAIVAPYRLDARRCISYLTIEHAGAIPLALRPLIGNRIYGCDDCQLVCPWNRFAPAGDATFAPRAGLDTASLLELFAWTEAEFGARLEGSPIRRIGFERWQRNLAVALGNLPETVAAETRAHAILALRERATMASPLLAEHLAWALTQLEGRI
ncbi:MAG: tRNA epoxyqueuosine(34) reductase QueG [Zoogloeaceae bacterium]|jgi:epoxyqueuosine reductase|nr:tRNA epoxyqueuosine(34) reductase QueG [Zoogloeaceae bacterium]